MERSFEIRTFPKERFLRNKHSQTIFSSFFPPKNHLRTEYLHEDIILDLADGSEDMICVHHNFPLSGYKKAPIPFNGYYFILIHGMEGSADSHYIVTFGEMVLKAGFGLIRMNQRGCGMGEGLSRGIYNAGNSNDIDRVVKYVYRNISKNIILCGYSLSANSVLKYLGEKNRPQVRFFSAVSPPLDLKYGCDYIDSEKGKFYRDFFLFSFKDKLKRNIIRVPDEIKNLALSAESMFDFDDYLTAPIYGYRGALDYYRDCSSVKYIYGITQEGIVIHANDDPLIPSDIFENVKWSKVPNIVPILTEGGGHVGFLTKKSHDIPDGRWLNHTLLHFFAEKIGIYEA
ncbi:MAG: alpha/beta hydrolase [Leptospiraceae bacterium]|nr:alpha/beta hydrolase [Leptospiraceae bacterium]MCP5513404.1 alpha/beta hydrolase [Leptospiraceae bacterium]